LPRSPPGSPRRRWRLSCPGSSRERARRSWRPRLSPSSPTCSPKARLATGHSGSFRAPPRPGPRGCGQTASVQQTCGRCCSAWVCRQIGGGLGVCVEVPDGSKRGAARPGSIRPGRSRALQRAPARHQAVPAWAHGDRTHPAPPGMARTSRPAEFVGSHPGYWIKPVSIPCRGAAVGTHRQPGLTGR